MSQPSRDPSIKPSNQPSHQPSNFPSVRPSNQPSSIPTSFPTKTPFQIPTRQPSGQPSNPTKQPRGYPTYQPTKQKPAAAITTATPPANKNISTATSQLPTYYTPQNIAEEYKSLAKVIQGTETTIAIDKIHAEGTIALARLEEEKKLKVFSFT